MRVLIVFLSLSPPSSPSSMIDWGEESSFVACLHIFVSLMNKKEKHMEWDTFWHIKVRPFPSFFLLLLLLRISLQRLVVRRQSNEEKKAVGTSVLRLKYNRHAHIAIEERERRREGKRGEEKRERREMRRRSRTSCHWTMCVSTKEENSNVFLSHGHIYPFAFCVCVQRMFFIWFSFSWDSQINQMADDLFFLVFILMINKTKNNNIKTKWQKIKRLLIHTQFGMQIKWVVYGRRKEDDDEVSSLK